MSFSFSFSRLGKLITKQFFENSRLYIFSVLALLGLLGLLFAFWIGAARPNYDEEATYIMFVLGLFITGSVFAGISFNMLGSRDKGIYWLSIPATHSEKLVCTILYSTVAFTLAYCLCFYIVKSVAVYFVLQYVKETPGASYTEITDFNSGFAGALKYFIYGYFAVQALYLLGSVYFSRYSFIITTVVGAAFVFVFIYYLTKVQSSVLGPVGWDFTSVRKYDPAVKGGYFLYSIPSVAENIIKYAMQFAWAPLFWLITWFRLKEKEI